MADKRSNPLAERLNRQKAEKEQPSILQDEEKHWNWSRILICILLVYTGVSFMHGCYSIIYLKSQQNAIVAQTQDAEATQKELENEVSYMQTNEAVEKTAREELNMVKPGEILLTQRVNDETDAGQEATDETDTNGTENTDAQAQDNTADGTGTDAENGESAQ